MIETRVVEVARVRARVKRVHIMALKRKLRMRKTCTERIRYGMSRQGESDEKTGRQKGHVRREQGIRRFYHPAAARWHGI